MQSSQQALKDRIGFAKDGCILAFGLSHSYPKTTGSLWAGLEDRLKGADAVLLQAVTRCGLTYSFKAAFNREFGEERMDDVEAYWDGMEHGLSSTTLNALYRNDLRKFEVE